MRRLGVRLCFPSNLLKVIMNAFNHCTANKPTSSIRFRIWAYVVCWKRVAFTCPKIAAASESTAMPPGPAYNWLCVLHSTAEILSHAARHRATQIVPRSTSSPLNSRKRRRKVDSDVLVSLDHARSTEKSSGLEPIVNTSSITQNVDIQVRNTYTIWIIVHVHWLRLLNFLGHSNNLDADIIRTYRIFFVNNSKCRYSDGSVPFIIPFYRFTFNVSTRPLQQRQHR
jgi:hypothetical protein